MEQKSKFETCVHKAQTGKEVFIGCPCKKQTKIVFPCEKRNIIEATEDICKDCTLFELRS
jgi:hypothetical protein